jgi:hypothetical protein
VGKGRDTWVGVAIYRAAKKAISYQGNHLGHQNLGAHPPPPIALILDLLQFSGKLM